MTCIIGIETDDGVWMGGDACIVDGCGVKHELLDSSKVFENGAFLFGVSGSPRLNDVLQYAFKPPSRDEGDTATYLRRDFVRALHSDLRAYRCLDMMSGAECIGGDSHFLFAYEGKLYHCDPSMAIVRVNGGVMGIGSGGQYARGFVEGIEDESERNLDANSVWDSPEDVVRDVINSALLGAAAACEGVAGMSQILHQSRPI